MCSTLIRFNYAVPKVSKKSKKYSSAEATSTISFFHDMYEYTRHTIHTSVLTLSKGVRVFFAVRIALIYLLPGDA